MELGEIENCLLNHESVKAVAVLVKEHETGGVKDKQLWAYLVCTGRIAPGGDEFRNHLARSLPDYMIPSHFVTMDRFPLTPNGKIDRNALRASVTGTLQPSASYTPPRDERETAVAAIWKEVLNRDKVGRKDNFFHIGGNSINILTVSSRLEETFQVEIPMVKLFEHPTISDFSHYLAGVPGVVSQGETAQPGRKKIEMETDRSTAVHAAKQGRDRQRARRLRRM